MPQLDLIQECYVRAAPATVAARVHDAGFWAVLWPGLGLAVSEDRRTKGIRWRVAGDFVGSCEVWLEPYAAGVIVHCYLRVDPAGRPLAERAALRTKRRRQRQITRVLWALKDDLEGSRPPSAVPTTTG